MSYVLIIDDDEDFASVAADVLRSDGQEVNMELSIEKGRKSLSERVPDLLILDVMFPESSQAGFLLAREIRQSDEAYKAVPIVLLTAVNAEFPVGFSTSDIDDNWMPVEDFIEKPVDLDVLKSRVAKMLAG